MGVNDFTDFMTKTLDLLCDYIGAKKSTIYLLKDQERFDKRVKHFDTRIVNSFNKEENVKLSICCKVPIDPVIYFTMQEVFRLIDCNTSLNPFVNSNWFFNPSAGVYHSEETLAQAIYNIVRTQIPEMYGFMSGINLSLVLSIISEHYESSKSKGAIAFTGISSADTEFTKHLHLQFSSKEQLPLRPEMKKLIRKLLEGGDGDILVLSDINAQCCPKIHAEYCCVGYSKYDKLNLFPCIIYCEQRDTWVFRYASRNVFRFQRGNILCLQDQLKICIEDLKKVFRNIENIQPAISAISEQSHGSSIVLLDMSNENVKNYISNLETHKRALKIESILLNPSKNKSFDITTLTKLARVDGSFIIDCNNETLEYINVIVDGDSKIEGNYSFGARRTVVRNFIANIRYKCGTPKAAALIFSEDGGCLLVKADDLIVKSSTIIAQSH